MQSIPTRELVLACLVGYSLWLFVWALATMISLGMSLGTLLSMPFGLFCFFLLAFVILALVACFFLFAFYRAIGVCRLPSRTVGEVIYMLAFGFLCAHFYMLCGGYWRWMELFVGWGFFSQPAFYTVLCLRGWEWYSKKRLP